MTSALHEEFDDYGNILRVADLTFTDTILGEGSYGTVRLARRRRKKSQSQLQSQPQLLNSNSTNGSHDKYKVTTKSIKYSKKHDPQVYNANANANTSNNNNNNNNKDDELVAVKIYSKSVLHQIKELTKSSNPSHKNKRRMSIHDAYEKVEQEITIMKKMNHPNILQLYDIIDSIQSDTLYIVMEYLPLGNIMTFDPECMVFRKTITNANTIKLGLTKDGCYQESYAALYFVDILHGLKYLHEHHICHSDLKPDNIFIDGRGVAKIGDFGVSHLFEEEIEHEIEDEHEQQEQQNDNIISHDHKDGKLTKREGTYSFWSPEMCNTKSTSYSGYESDIWACGICLYIFISGKLPFYDEDTSELFKLIINAKVQFDDQFDQFDNHTNKFSISSKDLILSILKNDPNRSKRPSIDELLDHVFCRRAREQRISMLGGEMKNDMNMFLHSSCSSRQPCCTLL